MILALIPVAVLLIKKYALDEETVDVPVPTPGVSSLEPPHMATLTRQTIASALAKPMADGKFPESFQITVGTENTEVAARYTIDLPQQRAMEKLISTYAPDYAAFVALDATTGRVLTLVSYTREKKPELGNLALRASFPAASVFKIVTAAAALDEHKATPDTEIAFNGAYHTLYRRNVNDKSENKWTRHMTLREAFAKSVNTVFAKLGVFTVTSPNLRNYAQRFQFNRLLASDMQVQPSQFVIADDNPWMVAEVASGFNRFVTLSPIQGAMIAATVANDGKLMTPYLVESLTSDHGKVLYHIEPEEASQVLSAEAAASLRSMMHETVQSGTSRKAFRPLLRRPAAAEVEMGGKTGSMSGTDPKGKYDWFVGFARTADKRIAVAALTINEFKWRVKSSFLARAYFETYLDLEKRGKKAEPTLPERQPEPDPQTDSEE